MTLRRHAARVALAVLTPTCWHADWYRVSDVKEQGKPVDRPSRHRWKRSLGPMLRRAPLALAAAAALAADPAQAQIHGVERSDTPSPAKLMGCWTSMRLTDKGLQVGRSICIKPNGKISGFFAEDDGGGLLAGDFGSGWRFDTSVGAYKIEDEFCQIDVSTDGRTMTISVHLPRRDGYSACRTLAMTYSRCPTNDLSRKLCNQ